MTFQDKLNFLIHITNTSAVELSEKTGIATSTISLYRSGKRKFPRSIKILQDFSNYFSDRIENDYQRQALAEFSQNQVLLAGKENCMIAEQLMIWLSDKQFDASSYSSLLLSEILAKTTPVKQEDYHEAAVWSDANSSDSNVFFGSSGKQTALITVLDRLSKLEKPGTLYYMSDDCDLYIPTADSGSKNVLSLLRSFTEHGGKIIQILPPPTSPHFIDMIMLWSPLYLNGQAKPLFFPFMRDALFRGTIIAHENEISMTSLEVFHKADSSMSFVSTNADVIQHNIRMFQDCLEKCIPAFYYSTGAQAIKRFYELLSEQPGEAFCATSMLPLELIPLESIQDEITSSEAGSEKYFYTSLLLEAVNAAKGHLSHNMIYSCSLAGPNKVRAGLVRKIIPGMSREQSPFHTIESYRNHLSAIIEWMKTGEQHYLVPSFSGGNAHGALYVYHGSKAFVLSTVGEFTLYEITEPLLVKTCEEYIFQRLQSQRFTGIEKANVLQKLQLLYNDLQ